jgi:tetratricopeptide (TPR) repeat protein
MTLDETLQIAVQHHQAGRLGEAEKHYQQILAQQPVHPDALHLLGVIAAQTARRETAINLINRAIAARPNAPEFHSNLGHVLRESGRLEEAAAAYRRALEIKPDSVDDYQYLGITLSQLGQLNGAIDAHRQAYRLKPDSPQVFDLFRNALSAGITACRQDMQRNPGDVEAHFKLGRLLREIGDTAGALAAFGAALRIDRNRPDIESEAGVALDLNGEFDKAIAAHHRALRLNPNFADAHFNLAHAYSETGRFDDSVASYAQAARLKPDWPDAHWNLSLALLLRGDYMRGWTEYEWRWRLPGSPSITHNVVQPMWDGRDLTGTTVLLRPEQGFGDTIQFIRYTPLVARRGARLLLTSQPELSRLLQCVTEIQQVPSGQLHFDLHCPLMRLPLIFGTTLDSIPANIPYLQADPGLVEAWGRKLGSSNGRLRVGLAWAGLPSHQNDRNRSMTLAMLAPLAGVTDVDFYSLQKGPAAPQAKNPPPGMRLIDFAADIKDFADTAAIISHLDLVIAIDTSVVHLAGAMGKPVWTMLPFKPDWRWLTDREDSPWYPTMRLFRQKSRGAWGEVIERIVAALRAQVARAARP